ncbi:RHS repeat-associated core domain-containing protein [Tenacibaculum maritimum]|uniref:RHS repeat domain-containing protein n=1 Tax=Tenacibaculum maritimum TaxID=107401 RepID=UPI00388F8129
MLKTKNRNGSCGFLFGLNLGYKSIPIQAYDARGNIVWECELDIYGKVRNLHGEKTFIPFRYQGQYEDIETGLYYNRFRYYSPDTGTYISKDPIGLEGGNNFYAYVPDVNNDVDVFGLMPLSNPVNQGHHIVPHKAATDLGVRPFNNQTGGS